MKGVFPLEPPLKIFPKTGLAPFAVLAKMILRSKPENLF
jgi:hypothetical protein